jgi:hypothetical protein
VGVKPMISVFEWTKTVYALERSANVIGGKRKYMDSLCAKWSVINEKLEYRKIIKFSNKSFLRDEAR